MNILPKKDLISSTMMKNLLLFFAKNVAKIRLFLQKHTFQLAQQIAGTEKKVPFKRIVHKKVTNSRRE